MNHDVRVESVLERFLAETPISRAPDQLRADIASATSRQRQRPPWLTNLKEPPMRYRSRVAVGSPTARLAALAAVTMLVAILCAGALVVGAQSPSPTPPEVPAATAAAWVTGTVTGGTGGQVSSGASDTDGVTRYRYHWEDMAIAMSDPRLSGTIATIYDQDIHTGAAGDVSRFSVGAGTYRIENDAGSWEGPSIFLNEGSTGTGTSETGLLVGSGAYEGLSAFLVFDFSQTEAPVVGVIFPGKLPPVVTFE